jgi:hypothetical protein
VSELGPSPRLRLGEALPVPRDLLTVAPHAESHHPALRVGLSAAVPILLLWMFAHLEWAPYALLAVMVSVFGRRVAPWGRLRLQAAVACVQVALIVTGTALAVEAPGLVAIVLVTALVAGSGTLLADAMGWTPPGSLFFVFAFGVCSALPSATADIASAAVVSAGSAGFALFVTAAWAFVEARTRTASNAPTAPAQGRALLVTHALVCFFAAAIAGLTAVSLGLSHPYWAMVSAIVPVVGSTTSGQLLRAGHRVIGTGLGLGVAFCIFAWPLEPFAVLLLLIVLTVATEMFVARNYSIALLFLTPLTIGMPYLAGTPVLEDLLFARGVETVIGVGIAVLLILATHPARHPRSSKSP